MVRKKEPATGKHRGIARCIGGLARWDSRPWHHFSQETSAAWWKGPGAKEALGSKRKTTECPTPISQRRCLGLRMVESLVQLWFAGISNLDLGVALWAFPGATLLPRPQGMGGW